MLAFLPLAFVVGALVGAGLTWWASGRFQSARDGRYGLGALIATSVITLTVAALAAYGAIKWKYRARPVDRASVDDTVRSFRKLSRAAADAGPATGRELPAAGVYTYRGGGFFKMDAPIVGKQRRDLPAAVPAMLVIAGDCWELKISYFKQQTWKARYCKSPAGALRMEWVRTHNEVFGRVVGGLYGCTPPDIIRAGMKVGDRFMTSCGSIDPKSPSSATTNVQLELLGEDSVRVGDQNVSTWHVLRTVKVIGRQSGVTVRNLWFSKDTGMLVRVREHAETSGLVKYKSDWELTLTQTTPRK